MPVKVHAKRKPVHLRTCLNFFLASLFKVWGKLIGYICRQLGNLLVLYAKLFISSDVMFNHCFEISDDTSAGLCQNRN